MDTYYAEASVLGSILFEGSLFSDLVINEDYFFEQRHKEIFIAMKAVHKNGEAINAVTVTNQLGEEIHSVGGVTYLVQLAESVPSTSTLKSYEQILIEAYQLFKTKERIAQFMRKPSYELIDDFLSDLYHIRDLSQTKEEDSTYDSLIEISKELLHPEDQRVGYKTSLPSLDEMTGGLQPGELIIIAARPSVGKTAFALNLAAGHCKNGGTSLVFSLEMERNALLKRMISAEAKIHGSKWRNILERFTENDYREVMQAIGEVSRWSIELYDRKHTIAEIRAQIRKQLRSNPDEKHLVLIDYLQLITPATIRRDRRDLEIGEITRELKLLAIELKVPIILLSQLSRGVESRQDKRPLMSDLRESGNIEQDADVVSFLYREDYYEKQSDKKNELEVIISKQRNGPTGTVKMEFFKEYGLVREVERELVGN